MKVEDGYKKRIWLVFGILLISFSLIVVKALFIQVINRDKFLEYSKSQTLRTNTVYHNRGNIYDRNNEPLAINVKTYNIFTVSKNISVLKNELYKLSKISKTIDYNKLIKYIKKREGRFTWISRKVVLDSEQVEKIKLLNDIYIEEDTKRVYPNGDMLGQVLGFVGVDNSGLAGLEYSFDSYLKGEPKKVKYLRDAKGRPIKFESIEPGQRPDKLVLTIDKNIQAYAEEVLKQGVIDSKAVGGGVAVMDAKSGEVLAIANYPSYDPNNYSNYKSSQKRLSIVTDPFEPGSIMKIMTVISALENGIVNPNTSYYCEKGSFRVQDHYITEAESRTKHEWLTVSEIIEKSSNIGTTKIAFDLTYPKLYKTLKRFGLGEKTGIEISGESRGIFPDDKKISPLTLSNVSFGQGLATTGIQILSAISVIANGGYKVRPTIVSKKSEYEQEKILDDKIVEQVLMMLVKTVETGSGKNAKIPYYRMAGKTSTAQKVSKNGGYSGYISGFIGFPVGVSKPFVTYVYLDEPKSKKYYGGQIAAPLVKNIAEFILLKDQEIDKIALKRIKDENVKVDTISKIQSSVREIREGEVPSFVGLDKLSAKTLANKLGISVKLRGVGIVNNQSIPIGTKIKRGMRITLEYSPPELP